MTDTTTPTPLFARTIAAALPLLARLTFAAVLLPPASAVRVICPSKILT